MPMAIQYCGGSIFTSTAQTLVAPVNCKGEAFCGLALQFKERYPNWYGAYRQCCTMGALRMGRPLLHWGDEPWIISFPTKDDWRLPSELAFLEAGLAATVLLCARHGVESIAFPKLGTGAGGLSWEEVRPLMEAYLCSQPWDVCIYV
jgi:O-acetyl-ADP-ribose deacetylase (regulator of RNase III)